MEELVEYIQSENALLDRQMEERKERWNNFWQSFSSYNSMLKIDNRPLLGPVMTAERRQEMLMYKKQACIAEIRLKTKSRDKEFLNRVQRSLEEIQRETSEIEMPLHRNESVLQSSQFTPCLELLPSHPDDQHNNNATDSQSSTTDSLVQGETIHLKPVHVQNMKFRSRHDFDKMSSPAQRGSDSVQTSDSEETRDLIVVTVPKIHRRRRESGGSTGSETSCKPDHKFRPRAGSNSSISSEPVRVWEREEEKVLKATVKRSGSDSRLRRSGSERMVKRSDSTKSLRRTGSGDIPTAIRSESNPRIHKRSGSGDMSSLVSSKQSAINKLTRSYDMSIRSLMSEELSLRTLSHQNEAKLRSDIEPVELAQQLFDSKVLSPKYLSSSPHAKEPAVKLISRGDKPIKKTSPNKDSSGPPQPIKAIHTLPPSMPTSRENTFESLPLKSPLPSDDEEKRSMRFPEEKSPLKSPLVEPKFVADSLDDAVIGSAVVGISHQEYVTEKPADVLRLSHYESGEEEEETIQQDKGSPSHKISKPIEIPTKASCDDTITAGVGTEHLTDHVTYMETHELEAPRAEMKTEPLRIQKGVTTPVWNLLHSSIDSPGFLHLPTKLNPSLGGDNLAQQWIVDKISQLHSSGEVDIDDWLQNAPDSVKQKLYQLHPNNQPDNDDDVDGSNQKQDVCLSIDDTLRSTSPLPESEEMPVIDSYHHNEDDVLTSPESDTAERKRMFLRSNSYTLEKPSVALLIAERANRMSQVSTTSSKSEIIPSPEKSESLPKTHNRVEAKYSLPSKLGSPTPKPAVRYRSQTAQPTNQPATTIQLTKDKTASPTTRPIRGKSPSAIERNKAIASKSYIVDKPSAALLDSLNDSQKSAAESVMNSAHSKHEPTQRGDKSCMSSSPDSLSRPDSRNSDSMKRTAQRKLEYFSLDKLTAQSQQQPSNSQKSPSESHPNQSHKPQHHSIKHESPDVPKRVHIQRYLQQLGLAEHPVQQPVKEAWTEGLQQEPQSLTPPKTQSTPLSARTSPENEDNSATKKQTARQVSQTHTQQKNQSNVYVKPNTGEKTKLVEQVRRELTLLKSKYSKKLSPRSKNERPVTAQPSTHPEHQHKQKENRPSTASVLSTTQYQKQGTSHPSHTAQPARDKNLSEFRDRLLYAHKQQGSVSGHNVKSFAEKEATPITTNYSSYMANSIDGSISEFSSYGAIHSVTHPRPQSSHSPSQLSQQRLGSTLYQHHQLINLPASAKLAALIKGHLCRRLLATSEVQSIVKTIKDCRSLLPARLTAKTSATHSTTQPLMSLQDLNFQERLLDQWQAALLDIHKIFFELHVSRRIPLIYQSEVQMKAKAHQKQQQQQQSVQQSKARVVRRASNKEQPSKRRISAVTQRVIERKKVQKAAADSVTTTKTDKNTTTVTLKKAVLAPTFAASSPKKSTQSTSGRVTKTYLRQSPRRSVESPRRKK